MLDTLLQEAGFEFQWNPTRKGVGGYVSRLRDSISVSSRSESAVRQPTGMAPEEGLEVTPEVADARQFEERLKHGIKEGSFYTLLVNPKYYQRACQELCRRFPVELVDFEGLFLDVLRRSSIKRGRSGMPWSTPTPHPATPGGISSWSW